MVKRFKEAGIYEAINDAQKFFERVENPSRALKLVIKSCLIFIFHRFIVSKCFYIPLYIIPHCMHVIKIVKIPQLSSTGMNFLFTDFLTAKF